MEIPALAPNYGTAMMAGPWRLDTGRSLLRAACAQTVLASTGPRQATAGPGGREGDGLPPRLRPGPKGPMKSSPATTRQARRWGEFGGPGLGRDLPWGVATKESRSGQEHSPRQGDVRPSALTSSSPAFNELPDRTGRSCSCSLPPLKLSAVTAAWN